MLLPPSSRGMCHERVQASASISEISNGGCGGPGLSAWKKYIMKKGMKWNGNHWNIVKPALYKAEMKNNQMEHTHDCHFDFLTISTRAIFCSKSVKVSIFSSHILYDKNRRLFCFMNSKATGCNYILISFQPFTDRLRLPIYMSFNSQFLSSFNVNMIRHQNLRWDCKKKNTQRQISSTSATY